MKAGLVSGLESAASNYRYKVGAIVLVIFIGSCFLLLYLYGLRNDLDAYVMPRVITEQQAEQIVRTLQGHDRQVVVNVLTNVADPEALEYGKQDTGAITGGGWKVNFIPINPWDEKQVDPKIGPQSMKMYLALDQGIVQRLCLIGQRQNPDPKHPTPDAILATAFRAAHIEFGPAVGKTVEIIRWLLR